MHYTFEKRGIISDLYFYSFTSRKNMKVSFSPLHAVSADSKTKPFLGVFLSPLTEASLWCSSDYVHFGAEEGEGEQKERAKWLVVKQWKWKSERENPDGCGAAHSIRQPSEWKPPPSERIPDHLPRRGTSSLAVSKGICSARGTWGGGAAKGEHRGRAEAFNK